MRKKYEMGGTFKTYEIVVVSKELEKDGGRKHRDRFLISAEDEHSAKAAARRMWYEEFGDGDLMILEVLTDDEYRDKYLSNTRYEDGGEMLEKTVGQEAESAVGSYTWARLSEEEKAGVVSELAIDGVIGVQMAEGAVVATGFKVIFTLENGKKVEKIYKTQDEMDEGIADAYIQYNGITNVSIEEEKPKEKVSLFSVAKKAPEKKKKGSPKPEVQIDGTEGEIERYYELKEIIDNAKSEQELIGGRLKEAGKDAFLELYEQNRRKPDNFNIVDGDEEILFIVMDKYKKVEPEKEAMLEKYEGLLEKVTTFKFNPDVLDRVGEKVSELIMNSDLSEEDKSNLIIKEETVAIKKGSIDRLMDYKNPSEVFDLIAPILALK